MIDRAVHPADGENVETVLRHELARGNAIAETARPLLRQLVAADGTLPVTDEGVARIRGMLEGIAGTLLYALPDPAALDVGPVTRALIDVPELLSHLHAAALEWQLAERLQMRLALDPVVPPLLEEVVSGHSTCGLAAKFLSAQARWCGSQRVMRLALTQLPGELFDTVILTLRAQVAHHACADEMVTHAEAELRNRYGEADRRLDLASQLVSELEGGAQSALSLGHAGVALFLTALALGSGQDRDSVVISTDEAQLARLALALSSTGLHAADVERQLLVLHPEAALPRGFDVLASGRASAVLSSGRSGL